MLDLAAHDLGHLNPIQVCLPQLDLGMPTLYSGARQPFRFRVKVASSISTLRSHETRPSDSAAVAATVLTGRGTVVSGAGGSTRVDSMKSANSVTAS